MRSHSAKRQAAPSSARRSGRRSLASHGAEADSVLLAHPAKARELAPKHRHGIEMSTVRINQTKMRHRHIAVSRASPRTNFTEDMGNPRRLTFVKLHASVELCRGLRTSTSMLHMDDVGASRGRSSPHGPRIRMCVPILR